MDAIKFLIKYFGIKATHNQYIIESAETTPSHICFRSPKVIAEQWEYTKDEKVVTRQWRYFYLSYSYILQSFIIIIIICFYMYCRLGIMTVDVFGYLTDFKNDYDTKRIVFVIQYQILIPNRVPFTSV